MELLGRGRELLREGRHLIGLALHGGDRATDLLDHAIEAPLEEAELVGLTCRRAQGPRRPRRTSRGPPSRPAPPPPTAPTVGARAPPPPTPPPPPPGPNPTPPPPRRSRWVREMVSRSLSRCSRPVASSFQPRTSEARDGRDDSVGSVLTRG